MPFLFRRRRAPPPALPDELWAHILSFLSDPHQLCAASLVCSTWHAQITSTHHDPVWHTIWARTGAPDPPTWARVSGLWRAQVSSSYRLSSLPRLLSSPISQHSARRLIVPPPADVNGHVPSSLRLSARPRAADLEALLGRALHGHALPYGAILAFSHGIALLLRPDAPQRRRAVNGSPVLHYVVGPHVTAVVALAVKVARDGPAIVALTADGALVHISVDPMRSVPLRCRVIDRAPPPLHDSGDGCGAHHVALSDDGDMAFTGFASGIIRTVNLRRGALNCVLRLPESPDMIVSNGEFVAACNTADPLALSAWRLEDATVVATFSATSVGWAGISRLTGLCTTKRTNVFAVLDTADVVRLVDVTAAAFIRAVDLTNPGGPRAPPGQMGAGGVASVPGGCLLRLADGRGVVMSASEVTVFDLDVMPGRTQEVRRLQGARHALLAMSMDMRVFVTAERDVFGRLAPSITGRPSHGEKHVLKVWDVSRERLVGEIDMPGPATGVSVCGDIVVAVCDKVGQAIVCLSQT